MWLRGIIPVIVFKLHMQFVTYSVLLTETIHFCKWQSTTFIMCTCNWKDTENKIKNALIWNEEYYIVNNLILGILIDLIWYNTHKKIIIIFCCCKCTFLSWSFDAFFEKLGTECKNGLQFDQQIRFKVCALLAISLF